MNVKTSLFLLLTTCLIACKKEKNKTACIEKNVTASALRGNWIDYHYPDIKPEQSDAIYFAYTRYRIQFAQDSFRMQAQNVTDAIIDSCKNDYNEYAQGKWSLNGRILTLEGLYTDSIYITAMAGSCYHNGAFSYNIETWLCDNKLKMKPAQGMGSVGGTITLVRE